MEADRNQSHEGQDAASEVQQMEPAPQEPMEVPLGGGEGNDTENGENE